MDKDTLYRYFSNSAFESERSEVRRWVEESPDNYLEFMSERHFFDTASMLVCESEAESEVPARVRRPWRIWTRVAAAAAIVAGTLGVQHVFLGNQESPMPMQSISVPVAQRLSLVLADGTTVWLNSATTLRFPGDFRGGTRQVEVDGEAYFKVAKDAKRPFTVVTDHGDVVATGTEFNVDSYSASEDFSVSLVEGAVHLSSPDTCIYMHAGEKIELLADGAFSQGALELSSLEWIDGLLSFNNLPMTEILARFEKYYGVTVRHSRSDFATAYFSGKFYLDEGVEQALNTLRHDIRFDYEVDKSTRTITIK